MAKAKTGDIFEIPTAKGFAYAQYTHEHPQLTSLIRVFEGLYPSPPDDWGKIVEGPVQFREVFRRLSHTIRWLSRTDPFQSFVAVSSIQRPERFQSGGCGMVTTNGRSEILVLTNESCRSVKSGTTRCLCNVSRKAGAQR